MTMRLGKIIMGMGIAGMILMGVAGCKEYESTIGKGVGTIAPYAGEPTLAPAQTLPKASKSLPEATKSKTLPKATKKAITEDSPGFDCRTQGNHICGPKAPGGHKAGCYDRGRLIIAWGNYSSPRKDALWGQLTSPCKGKASKKAQKVPGATIAGVCMHPSITRDMVADCNKLASRPAEKGAGYSNPQGRVLVKECTDQYIGHELAICLR